MSSIQRSRCSHGLWAFVKNRVPKGFLPCQQYNCRLINLLTSLVMQGPEPFLWQGGGTILRKEYSGKKRTCKCISYCCQIPTDGTLERMVCSVLSRTSEDEAGQEGHPGDCHPRWSAATDYLVHAVSWLQVYKQVRCHREPPRRVRIDPSPPLSVIVRFYLFLVFVFIFERGET